MRRGTVLASAEWEYEEATSTYSTSIDSVEYTVRPSVLRPGRWILAARRDGEFVSSSNHRTAGIAMAHALEVATS